MKEAVPMARNLPPLAQLRSLVAVVAHGRLNRAAEALELTESAVSHHLRKLEDTLGTRLLDRDRAGIVLTPAGERFHARAQQALQLLDEAAEEVRGAAGGKVLLTLPRTLATHWLVPRYPLLYRDNDDLELQLLPTTRRCDLERERIDLGLRLGNGDWPGLESRPLMPERICPVVVAEVAEQWRREGWDAVIRHARPVLNELHPDEWQQWCAATGRNLPATTRFTRLDSFDLVLQAGRSGSGLIMGRSPMINDALVRGDLVAPFLEWVETGHDYHVVWPEGRPLNRHAQRVLAWLERCAQERCSL
ncbi:MAG: LysR substrate-binding domain-containing protein [Halofilum sp. (in: g-proteobacteria)]|nr:LysR substrate-binding domain-containing protein [Halofilum sp. (in: g-proteobacteria)]